MIFIKERMHNNRQKNYFLEIFYSKTHKLILKSNSRNTINWLVDRFMQIKLIDCEQMAKSNTNLKSGTEADLKMLKTSKKYLQIHKFPFQNVIFLSMYSVQKVPENFSKTSLLGQGQGLCRVKKTLNYAKDNFVKKSLFLSTKRMSILLSFSFPSVSFECIF